MFLKTIGDAKLLNTKNELFVLRDAPHDTCLRLAETMVKYLLADVANEEKTLLTKSHVEWVMQILGRAFRLPIQHKSEKVISGAISLYRKWMHLPTAPIPIQQESLYFTKKMCCHLSFVFENRNISANSSEFQVHVSLCQRVLGIYSKSARTPPPAISEIDWNEFLCRIFLGICSEIMKPTDSHSLGNEIEQDVFCCMFDIWLRSKTQNEALWNGLLSMTTKEWGNCLWFVESWGQCCVALTRKLVNILYGGDNGTDAVVVSWPVLGAAVTSANEIFSNHKLSFNKKSRGFAESDVKQPLSMRTYIQIDDCRLLMYLWNCMINVVDVQCINRIESRNNATGWMKRMINLILTCNTQHNQSTDNPHPTILKLLNVDIMREKPENILQIVCTYTKLWIEKESVDMDDEKTLHVNKMFYNKLGNSIMLKTIVDAKLILGTRASLFVLRDAPHDLCLDLAETLVKYLLADVINEEKTLLTISHVEWVMQILGRALRLPIQQKSEKIISGAVSLYRKWIHLPTAPLPIQQNALHFTKRMCCHLSLVFENRNIAANSGEFEVHVSLCQRVLGIYSKSARTPPPEISESDWNEFLCRIFLGINL
eukprot:502271_1